MKRAEIKNLQVVGEIAFNEGMESALQILLELASALINNDESDEIIAKTLLEAIVRLNEQQVDKSLGSLNKLFEEGVEGTGYTRTTNEDVMIINLREKEDVEEDTEECEDK